MIETKPRVSRRHFISGSAALFLAKGAFAGQTRPPREGGDAKRRLQAKLITTFEDSGLLDISRDSRLMCLSLPGYRVGVIETGSWKNLHSQQLRAEPSTGSFFAESEAVYVGTEPFREDDRAAGQRTLIDLVNNTVRHELSFWKPGEIGTTFIALRKQLLLGEATINGAIAPTLVALPDYHEVLRVPPFKATDIAVSADRSVLVYCEGRAIACRRTEDLKPVWEFKIEGDLSVWKVGVTPVGDRVVAAAVDTAYLPNQHNHQVFILNGTDGTLLKSFPLNGFDGVQLSPDRTWLAVCNRADYVARQPSVSLYDVESGVEVTRLMHDAVPKGREFLLGTVTIQFSPDGRFLATSGIDTEIWDLT